MQEVNSVTIVIPCYNEEQRLSCEQISALLQPGIQLVLVNDGSSDQTLALLQQLKKTSPEKIRVVDLKKNRGKAEAVREGLLVAFDQKPDWVAYVDADFATPADEVLRLAEQARRTSRNVVMAARVALLGTNIHRKKTRHYLGRVFATFVSIGLNFQVYDTQCGAKFFRALPILRDSLQVPFESRWVFDIELIGRLLHKGFTKDDFVESPLNAWSDVDGSKLRLKSIIRAIWDLARLILRFRFRADGSTRPPVT